METNMRKLFLEEVRKTLMSVKGEELDQLVDAVLAARKIMVVGKGRVGIAMRTFATRLSHMGLDVSCLQDVTSPHLGPGDLVLIGNTNGCSPLMNVYLEQAHGAGAKVYYIVVVDGTVSCKAEYVLHIRARLMGKQYIDIPSVQPMCSTFEQVLMLSLDTVCKMVQMRLGQSEEEMRSRSINII